MHWFFSLLLAVGLYIMGFIGGVWFTSRKMEPIVIEVDNDDMSKEEVDKIVQKFVDRANEELKRRKKED